MALGNVVLDCVGSNVADRAKKLTPRPEVSAPQTAAYSWKLLKEFPRGDAFKETYHFRWACVRPKADKKMEVVRHHLKFMYHETVGFGDFAKNPLACRFNLTVPKDIEAILWGAHNVVTQLSVSMVVAT